MMTVMIGLVYDTRVAQMRAVLDGIEGVLRAHPKLLQFMEVVEASGAGFAFPTRTLHLATGEKPAGGEPARPV